MLQATLGCAHTGTEGAVYTYAYIATKGLRPTHMVRRMKYCCRGHTCAHMHTHKESWKTVLSKMEMCLEEKNKKNICYFFCMSATQ